MLEEKDDGIRVLSIVTREEISLDSACANTHTQSLLETESEHMDIPEYPQIANNFGNVPTIGTSTFPQTFNGVRNQAASSTSCFTAVKESTNSAAPGTSTFPPIVNSFGNVATSGNSGTNQKSSLLTDLKPLYGFGDVTILGETTTSTKGVFNPFEGSHLGNQPSLNSAHPQNDQDNGRLSRTTDTNRHGKSQFKKTFQPLPLQGERPTPRTDSSDMDHQMDTDGN